MTAPGEGQLVLAQAGAAVFAWEVGSLSASQCLRVSSQHLPAASFGCGSCSLLRCAGLLGSGDPQGHKCDKSEGLVAGKPFLEALCSHRNRSSFRQMSAGNGNQLQRPWGFMTGLLGNDTLAVPRTKCCNCCSQSIRKIYLAAHGSKNHGGLPKVSPAEQPLGGVRLLWAKCELGLKIMLFIIHGAERNWHRLIRCRVLLLIFVENTSCNINLGHPITRILSCPPPVSSLGLICFSHEYPRALRFCWKSGLEEQTSSKEQTLVRRNRRGGWKSLFEGLQEKVMAWLPAQEEEPGMNQQKDKAADGSGGRGMRQRRVGEMHRARGERVDSEEPVRKENRVVGVFGLRGSCCSWRRAGR